MIQINWTPQPEGRSSAHCCSVAPAPIFDPYQLQRRRIVPILILHPFLGIDGGLRLMMVTNTRPRRAPAQEVSGTHDAQDSGSKASAKMVASGTLVRWRRRQTVAIGSSRDNVVLLVHSGVIALQTTRADQHRIVHGIFYPGDVIETATAPPLADTALIAIAASEAVRMSGQLFETLAANEHDVIRFVHDSLARQIVRLSLHSYALSTLDSGQRVAALMIELTLRLARPLQGGLAFDMPFSRSDMASYLALNADTLSRHTSRLRTEGILEQTARDRVIIRNWDALLKECPIAAGLQTVHGPASLV